MASKTKKTKQIYPIVEIVWEDISNHEAGWLDTVDEVNPMIISSVGFLVKETDKHLVLAMDLASDNQHNQRAQIPLSVVRSRKVLRKVTTDGEKPKEIPPVQN